MINPIMTSIVRTRIANHIGRTLGPIAKTWDQVANGSPLPFEIVQVEEQPASGAVTFVTVGLSETELSFPSGRLARQELVFACYQTGKAMPNVPGLLAAIALELLAHRRAVARGEVEGPAGPIFDGSKFEAVYASLPAYFPNDFATCEESDPLTHFLWMIPLTSTEAEFVRSHGWSRFEDQMVKLDPDLLDLGRRELLLPWNNL